MVKCPVSGAKTRIQYVTAATFFIELIQACIAAFLLCCSGTYCGGSEFKCLGSVAKSLMLYRIGK